MVSILVLFLHVQRGAENEISFLCFWLYHSVQLIQSDKLFVPAGIYKMGRYKTGIACPNDSQDQQHTTSLNSRTFPAGKGMNLQFFSPLLRLLSDSELDVTTHIFSKDGRERVGVFSALLIRIDWHLLCIYCVVALSSPLCNSRSYSLWSKLWYIVVSAMKTKGLHKVVQWVWLLTYRNCGTECTMSCSGIEWLISNVKGGISIRVRLMWQAVKTEAPQLSGTQSSQYIEYA